MLQNNTLEFLNFIKGDTKKTELILIRRLTKLLKSTCKLLNIDLKLVKIPKGNLMYDILQTTIKVSRLIQRAVKTKATILGNSVNMRLTVDRSVSRETVLVCPQISANLDRKME